MGEERSNVLVVDRMIELVIYGSYHRCSIELFVDRWDPLYPMLNGDLCTDMRPSSLFPQFFLLLSSYSAVVVVVVSLFPQF